MIRRVLTARWRLVAGGGAALLACTAMATTVSAALPTNAAGGGVVSEQINFSTPIPPILYTQPTIQEGTIFGVTAWTFRDTGSSALYVDDGGLFYPAGPITINASGGSNGLENVAFGVGTFAASVSGSNTFGGSLNCTGIAGTYIRVGLVAQFAGNPGSSTASCTIDGQTVPMSFQGAGVITPTCSVSLPPSAPGLNCTGGRGVDSPITQANLQGVWVGIG